MPDDAELDRIILALLFASDEPLTPARIAQILEIPNADVIRSVDRLTDWLEDERFSARIERVASGYQLATRPEFSKYIARLYSGKRKQRLSKAGLETLAIIAYKQPITRAEIENIRGVSCGGVITTLMERSLIRISGKAKVLGSPFLYATTQEFLEYLGLDSLKDLPDLEELEALLEKEEYREDETAGTADSGGGEDSAGRPAGETAEPEDTECRSVVSTGELEIGLIGTEAPTAEETGLNREGADVPETILTIPNDTENENASSTAADSEASGGNPDRTEDTAIP
jgi:segregation and condensation protein B